MPSLKESAQVFTALGRYGIASHHAEELVKCARILHRWSEEECNGTIQRDGDEPDSPPHRWHPDTGRDFGRIPDREASTLKRIAAVLKHYPALAFHQQGDPRGAPLYLYRRADLRAFAKRVGKSPGEASIACCYSSIGTPIY